MYVVSRQLCFFLMQVFSLSCLAVGLAQRLYTCRTVLSPKGQQKWKSLFLLSRIPSRGTSFVIHIFYAYLSSRGNSLRSAYRSAHSDSDGIGTDSSRFVILICLVPMFELIVRESKKALVSPNVDQNNSPATPKMNEHKASQEIISELSVREE